MFDNKSANMFVQNTQRSPKMRMALALLGNQKPIRHWSDAVPNVANNITGAMLANNAQESENQRRREMARALQGAFAPAREGPQGKFTRTKTTDEIAQALAANPDTAEFGAQFALSNYQNTQQQMADALKTADQRNWEQQQWAARNRVDHEQNLELAAAKGDRSVTQAVERMMAEDRLTRQRDIDNDMRQVNMQRAEYGLPPLADGQTVPVSTAEQGTLADAKAEAAAKQAAAKKTAEMQAEASANLDVTVDTADRMLSVLDQVATFDDDGNVKKTHPGFSDLVGAPAYGGLSTLVGMDPIRGTAAADFKAVLDQIGGQQFLQAYEQLKGGGQITEVEGQEAKNAIARMNTAQTEKAFLEGVRDFRGVVLRAKSRALKKAGVGENAAPDSSGGWNGSPVSIGSETYSPEDIRFTAEQNNMTPQEVIRELERRAGMGSPAAVGNAGGEVPR